jgi:F0F1-type ATP synthase assembly protein I
MNKLVLGILLGAILGAVDGLTAWFAPEARAQLASIIIGATVKGIIAGAAIGFFARKVRSLPLGVLFGVAVGFLLAFIVAYHEHGHYFEIILPGSIVGLILGYITERYGAAPGAPVGR